MKKIFTPERTNKQQRHTPKTSTIQAILAFAASYKVFSLPDGQIIQYFLN